MKRTFTRILTLAILWLLGNTTQACNLSDLSLTSVVFNSGNNTYTINVLLHVGQGKTGVTTGADDATRTIVFAFYRGCGPMTVTAFTPSTLMAAFTGCNMPGSNLGAQGGVFNSQATVAYLDPGYYGSPPCNVTPFACVSSTAACGNVQSAAYNLSFTVSAMPDSMRVFGVEGNSNPVAGCYPNADMKIVFNTPMITCPGPTNLAANLNCQGILPNYTSSANVMYNCILTGPATVTQSPAPGLNVGGLGSSTTVTLTATYPNSSTVSCNFLTTVADLTPPNINCPLSGFANLNPNCQWITPNYALTAGTSDNCTASPTATQSPAPGTVFTGGGASTIVLTATDAAGNTTSCVFTVTRQESTPPTITCPGSQTLNLNSNCQAVLPNYASLVSAADNCPPNPTVTQNPAPGLNMTGVGSNTVTMTATDGSGNTATCTFTVTRVDASAPTITCPSAQLLSLSNNCQASLPSYHNQVSSGDNCTQSTISQSPPNGSIINGATTTTVTMTATDGAGNSSSCSFTVTTNDAAPPVLTCPPTQSLVLDANCEVTVPNLVTQTAVLDNCTPNLVITQSPAAGTVLSFTGSSVVTLSATDGNGNTGTCGVTLLRLDQTNPQITCPPNATVALGTNCQGNYASYYMVAVATDNCTSQPPVTQQPPAGSQISGAGTTTVTLTATDGSGNTASCTLTVTAAPATPGITTTNPTPCQGQSVTLGAGATGIAYLWSSGATTPTINVSNTGWYWVDITLSPGCQARDSIFVTFAPPPAVPAITQNGNQLCTGSYAGYQWFLNGIAIPGATSSCVNVTAGGTYTVTVMGSNGCTATSTGFIIVGIENPTQLEFQVYPVPATTEVKLRLPVSLDSEGETTLFDLTGRVVRQWAFTRLDEETRLSIEGLSGGTYILELRTPEWAAVRKVVKLD